MSSYIHFTLVRFFPFLTRDIFRIVIAALLGGLFAVDIRWNSIKLFYK